MGKDRRYMDVSIAVAAGILTKYDPASQRYECAVCSKIGFGDVMPHMASPQHKNSAAWEIIHAKTPNEAMLSFLPETVREAKINDDIEAVDRNVFSYQCKICIGKRPFNGLTPLESHLCGIDHHKNKSKRAMNISMKLKYDSSPVPNYSSTPKNHQVSNPESVSAGYVHEGGAKSKHNPSWPPKTLPDSCPPDPTLSNSNNTWNNITAIGGHFRAGYANAKAETYSSTSEHVYKSLQPPPVCRGNPTGGLVLRSSPTSYSQEECFPQEVVDALKSNIVIEKEKTGSWTSYFCRACNVPLTGLKPLMQHLDSVKHQRKVTGSQLLPQNSSGPSNESSGADVHDFGTPYSPSASAAEALKSGVVEERDCGYFCKVCNVPLTGPMPLSQHAESEKHRKKAMIELNRNMSRLMVQDTSDQHMKDNNEWQQNQQKLILKVQNVSDSEIINTWQHQRNQYQEDACNEETETDDLVCHQYPTSADNSIKEVPVQQTKHGTNHDQKIVSFNESLKVTAMNALECVDYFEHKESSEFCQFITSELNKLDPDLCKKAKRKIQLVLFEYQDIQDQRDGNSSQDPWSLTTASYANTLFSPRDFISEIRAMQPIGTPKNLHESFMS
ncbi:uncharacterized protein [Macrobrachium rosenbergii]|uniref:uncharacterized protein isoform X5 n=1 Tax=Macrobrachium rosenbergii TaxID=79674 RepID=UPI0034D4D459